MNLLDPVVVLGDWILANLDRVSFSVIAVVVGYVLYRVVARGITRLKDQEMLGRHVAYTLTRIVRWVFGLAVLSVVLAQFGVTLGFISGVLALLGGTIIGFAAINTIGNAIAGLIVMTSRPFRVARALFQFERNLSPYPLPSVTTDNRKPTTRTADPTKNHAIHVGK